MRLIEFRVTNFRSVSDSGWIGAERVTALIGVNESGKTNLLLPLWKLNPAREGDIKPTSDYPKARYAEIRAKPGGYTFISARFDASAISQRLSAICDLPAEALGTVEVRRAFDGEYSLGFPDYQPEKVRSRAVIDALLDEASSQIGLLSPLASEVDLKAGLLSMIDAQKVQLSTSSELAASALRTLAEALRNTVPATLAKKSVIGPRMAQLVEAVEEHAASIDLPDPAENEQVRELVLAELPIFVYYSNYGNLDSEIYLPHVVENQKRKDLGAREAAKARTLKVLFSFVRLEAKEILELGRDFKDPHNRAPSSEEIDAIATKKRERTILLHSAGTALTRDFGSWWKQGDYAFDFQADGDHFRIWVSDNRRPEKVELEDRSSGLQWFLSFYLIFLVESTRDHANAILLLDEPGLSLHPLAQRDLSAFFEGLAESNQIIYTTHSPFLVDADMLERARKVYVAPDGSTKATDDLRKGFDDPRKAGATYAIYSALNMNVAESLLFGCEPIIVEGPSDQHYLSAIKSLLIGCGKISPKREIVFAPAHGARNAMVVASLLTGRDEALPIMLLDGDEAGEKAKRDLQNGLYKGNKSRILTTDDFVGMQKSEVEDLFPPTFLADVVDRWQRSAEQPFSDVIRPGSPIVPQIERWAETQGLNLEEGWKVELARASKKRALVAPEVQFNNHWEIWTNLFSALLSGN